MRARRGNIRSLAHLDFRMANTKVDMRYVCPKRCRRCFRNKPGQFLGKNGQPNSNMRIERFGWGRPWLCCEGEPRKSGRTSIVMPQGSWSWKAVGRRNRRHHRKNGNGREACSLTHLSNETLWDRGHFSVLLGVTGKWSACGWSMVQLDHDGTLGLVHCSGTMDAEVETNN